MIIVIIPLIAILILFINTIIASAPAFIGFVKSLNLSSINSSTIQNFPPIQHYFPTETSSPIVISVFNSINQGVDRYFNKHDRISFRTFKVSSNGFTATYLSFLHRHFTLLGMGREYGNI